MPVGVLEVERDGDSVVRSVGLEKEIDGVEGFPRSEDVPLVTIDEDEKRLVNPVTVVGVAKLVERLGTESEGLVQVMDIVELETLPIRLESET